MVTLHEAPKQLRKNNTQKLECATFVKRDRRYVGSAVIDEINYIYYTVWVNLC